MAGLDANGLTIKRLPEIIEDILAEERASIDANISASDNEFLGQLNTIFASTIADIYELMEVVNDSMDLDKAEGNSLDKIGQIIGIPRQLPLPTSGMQRFTTTNGTTIVSGFLVQNPITRQRFYTTATRTITTASCLEAVYSIKQLLNETVYTIAVNGNSYAFESDVVATAVEILNGIAAQITLDADATWEAEVNETDETLTIRSTNGVSINISSVTYISADSVSQDLYIESTETGATVVPANSVISNVSIVSGFIATNNNTELTTGRGLEGDEDYRSRLKTSKAIRGKSTLEAIRAAILDLDGVDSVAPYENTTMIVDGEGRPAKSFEMVVFGGDETEIANAIWVSKPAGIASYGNTDVIITDSVNKQHTVSFTRTELVNIALRITYDLYDEEVFPDNGGELIAETAMSVVNGLGTNVDLIPTRLFGPIYSAVPGINSLLVEVQVIPESGDTPDPGDWVTTKITIGYKEAAITALTDITIV